MKWLFQGSDLVYFSVQLDWASGKNRENCVISSSCFSLNNWCDSSMPNEVPQVRHISIWIIFKVFSRTINNEKIIMVIFYYIGATDWNIYSKNDAMSEKMVEAGW